ncbi:MAG: DNA translocase FtsK [Candidatus Moranbacteria bacterium]|nr:DNA translocase FtsK [Candidatus Moranbacteria bacterium]
MKSNLFSGSASNKKVKRSEIILKTFKNFGIKMKLKENKQGPISSYFIFDLITPTRMKDLDGFVRDLNYALATSDVRIDAPIPDTSLIGIEVPNKERVFVDIKEMWNNQEFLRNKEKLLIPFGRMVGNKDLFVDLFKLPHLLISGSTGTGKTNFLHCLISSLIKKFSAEEVKFILVDNKRVEFTEYNGVPHLLTEPIVKNNITMNALCWLNREMEERFKLLEDAGARDIVEYNKKAEEKMPYILFINDEFADDMIVEKKRFEDKVIPILQMGRAVGLHIILMTARPCKKNIENLMGANISARLCFAVCCASDSKVVIYSAGAERLLDKGDALFLDYENIKPIRLQTPYISEVKLKEIIENAKEQYYFDQDDNTENNISFEFNDREIEDELYSEVKEFAIEKGIVSTASIQRNFKIGYNRSARLMDKLEEDGVIGEADGSKPRKVLQDK